MVNEHHRQDIVSVPLIGPQGWLLATNYPNPHYYNIARLLEMPSTTKPELVEQAVEHLLIHHDALRTRFAYDRAIWQQYILASDKMLPFTYLDLSAQSQAEQQKTIEATAEQSQRSLNLFHGPVLQVVLFNLGRSKSCRLLLIIHHIIADDISFQIIINDLLTVYTQLDRGEAVQLTKTSSFKEYADLVAAYLQSEIFRQEADYWFKMPWAKVIPLPVDYPEGKNVNTVASIRYVSASLSIEETQALLHIIPRTYKVPYMDVLLTCLVQTFTGWTGVPALQVSIVFNGRVIPGPFFEKINLLRTVGFLSYGTELLILEIQKNQSTEQQLRSVQQQLLCMPHRGASCQWLRYLSNDVEFVQKRQMLPKHEVVFIYHGRSGQSSSPSSPFQPAPEKIGRGQDPQNPRGGLLVCRAEVRGGRFVAAWEYSQNIHRTETIEMLAQGYIEHLRFFIKNAMA